jgi:hypothetical protein
MIPDPYKKTIKIPVRVNNGKLEFFYGGKLPKLSDGTIGDLIVPSYALKDERKVKLLDREIEIKLMPAGTILMARMDPKGDDHKKKGIQYKLTYPNNIKDAFIEFRLEGALFINLRSTKKGALRDCECSIPALEKKANSVNHAYTMISEHFETHRRSHSGNVFEKIFYYDHQDRLRQLKYLRRHFEAEYEQELIILNQEWWYQKDNNTSEQVWALIEKRDASNFVIYCINQNSIVDSEFPFNSHIKAIEWLNGQGYNEFDTEKTPEKIVQPIPPYKKISGEIIKFYFQISFENEKQRLD